MSVWVCWSLSDGDSMGDVVAKFRVTPKQGADVSKLKEDITKALNPKDIKEVPVAFGLIQLEVLVLFKGGEGDTDKIESELRKMVGVGDVTTEDVTLL